MRNGILLLFVFIVIAACGFLLPGLFGFSSNIFLFAFLMYIMVCRQPDHGTIWAAVIAALASELIVGEPVGGFALPVLALLLGLAVTGKFVNLFPYQDNRSGVVMKTAGPAVLAVAAFGLFSLLFAVFRGLGGQTLRLSSLAVIQAPVLVAAQVGALAFFFSCVREFAAYRRERRRYSFS